MKVVVAFPAGSAQDTYVRLISNRMQPRLAQNILVDNRPGAGGQIGTQYAIAQKGDGYTFVIVTQQMAIKSAMQNSPFDIRKDLVHIVRLTETPICACGQRG